MHFLKYLFLFFVLFLTQKSFASCPYPSTYPGIANKPFPTTVCYPESGGNGYCKFRVIDSGLDIKVACTKPEGCSGQAYAIDLSAVSGHVWDNPQCKLKPLQEGCQRQPDGSIECDTTDDPTTPKILNCTTKSCLNPDNLRCPMGYVGGYVNGQNTCTKSNKTCDDCIPDPDQKPDPNPTCPDCITSLDSEKIIAAINNAKDGITDAVNSIGTTFKENLDTMKTKLSEISDKIANLSNSDNDPNNNNSDPDTSQLAADVPTREISKSEINDSLFTSRSQCPPDNELNMDFFGHQVTHTFSYSVICDALNTLSYLVMIIAYMYSAIIVSRS